MNPNDIINASDPQYRTSTPGELATIIIEACVYLLNFLLLFYVVKNRNYPPLKVKQIPLVAALITAGFAWWLGGLAQVRLFPQVDHPVFLVCDLWAVWFQLVLGNYPFISICAYRYLKLFLIIKARMEVGMKKDLIYLGLMWLPVLILGIAYSAIQIDGPITVNGVEFCSFQTWGFYILIGMETFWVLLFFALMYVLRSPGQQYLREYQETFVQVAIFLVGYLIFLAIQVPNYQFFAWGRIISSVVITLIPTLSFHLMVTYRAYQCFFHHDEYLTSFQNKLKMFDPNSSIGKDKFSWKTSTERYVRQSERLDLASSVHEVSIDLPTISRTDLSKEEF